MSDTWDRDGGYDLAVHGPNGFFRGFSGGDSGAELDVRSSYDDRPVAIALRLANPGRRSARVTVRDGYGSRLRTLVVGAGQTVTERWPLARSRGWYDLLVTIAGDPHFQRRYAGHVGEPGLVRGYLDRRMDAARARGALGVLPLR